MTAPQGRGLAGPAHVVVMGVAGCGKSEVGTRLAEALGLPLVEGDAFHPPSNIDKMRRGVALDDADRAGWLDVLARELAARPAGAVLTCSALKRAYRDRLRAAVPRLAFVHLALSQQQAMARVQSRGGHFYPPSLVASQFVALEDPAHESLVVTVDATAPLEDVARSAIAGLRGLAASGSPAGCSEFNNP